MQKTLSQEFCLQFPSYCAHQLPSNREMSQLFHELSTPGHSIVWHRFSSSYLPFFIVIRHFPFVPWMWGDLLDLHPDSLFIEIMTSLTEPLWSSLLGPIIISMIALTFGLTQICRSQHHCRHQAFLTSSLDFSNRPESRYSRFCRPYDVGCTLQLCHHSMAAAIYNIQTNEHGCVQIKHLFTKSRWLWDFPYVS